MNPNYFQSYLDLKQFTQARLFQPIIGHSLSTREVLKFNFDHAEARDAIHRPWNVENLINYLEKNSLPYQWCETEVRDRAEYLKRPDKGRRLAQESKSTLCSSEYDLAIVISNGLSSAAIEKNIVPMLEALLPKLNKINLKMAPMILVENGRVALGDEIGEKLQTKLLLYFIGERPGLSSPDSMGLYFTYNPRMGKTDADRNCLSNIRSPEGLSYLYAAEKIEYLVKQSMFMKLSGVQLKDQMPSKETQIINQAIN